MWSLLSQMQNFWITNCKREDIWNLYEFQEKSAVSVKNLPMLSKLGNNECYWWPSAATKWEKVDSLKDKSMTAESEFENTNYYIGSPSLPRSKYLVHNYAKYNIFIQLLCIIYSIQFYDKKSLPGNPAPKYMILLQKSCWFSVFLVILTISSILSSYSYSALKDPIVFQGSVVESLVR